MNLAPGVFVPMPTRPSFRAKRMELASESVTLSAELELSKPAPLISSREAGLFVLMPMFCARILVATTSNTKQKILEKTFAMLMDFKNE